jgi:hypothetical protein
MRFEKLAGGVTAIVMLAVPAALAQPERPATQPSAPSARSECPPDIGRTTPRSPEITGSRSLSEQLSESKGVICPPAGVDPGISVPPVGGGRTPVIPPPGTPGGDPNVVPKAN